MIYIICGDPGSGKTSLSTAIACHTMIYDRQRYLDCCEKIDALNATGYHIDYPAREHAVAANYDIFAFNQNCSGKTSYRFDPFKFVLPNDDIDYSVIYPGFEYHITEGQAVYDSRKSRNFRACCSRLFENHRHNDLDIYIDCQRHGLIDQNIREIAKFIYMLERKPKYDKFGQEKSCVWHGLYFEDQYSLDEYIKTRNPKLGTPYKYTFDGDILAHYDNKENRKAFYNFDKNIPVSIDSDSEAISTDTNYLLNNNNFREGDK